MAGIVVRIPLLRRIPCKQGDRIARSTLPADAWGIDRRTSRAIFRRP
ncbi:hypothetical protein MMEU_1016 [Mycobacterium marinum str. Europe]|nr:hypothetical protein MMEU_1016 [Mycobacterium marinum str. Europe]